MNGLATVLQTHLLHQRASRPVDVSLEAPAIAELVKSVAEPPHVVLQRASATALRLCGAHSAGLAILAQNDRMEMFTRPAIAGAWAPYVNSTAPRSFSPYGIVVDRNSSQLFRRPQQYYTYVADVRPSIEEVLLAPFSVDGATVGALWVVLHDTSRTFDAEDERLLNSLSRCASAVHQVALTLQRLSSGESHGDVAADLLRLDQVLHKVPGKPVERQLKASLRRKLSRREFEVVRLVAEGYTNKAIAERLGITDKSVETYRSRACDKAGFRTRADFVRFAVAHRLLST